MLLRKNKTIIALMVTSILLISSFGAYAAAKKEASIFKAPGEVTIDGKLDDWRLVDDKSVIIDDSKMVIDGGDKWGGPKDLSGKVYFMWDNTALYIAALVTDNEPMVNTFNDNYIFQGDSVEIYFSKTNAAKPSFTRDDYQFGLSTGVNGKNALIWIWDSNGMKNGNSNSRAKDSAIAVAKTDDGYIIEAKVAWSNFEGYTPKPGAKVGLTVTLNDFDPSNNSTKSMTWEGCTNDWQDPASNWQCPASWGVGIIAE
jgi:hypothetical protein